MMFICQRNLNIISNITLTYNTPEDASRALSGNSRLIGFIACC